MTGRHGVWGKIGYTHTLALTLALTMFSELRRFLVRPSGRLARAVLTPVSLIYLLFAVYGGILVIQAGNRLDSARLASAAETLGRTWSPTQDPASLVQLAAEEGWERIWIVSATGRIVSSSEIGETGAMVDGSFWDGLPTDETTVQRTVNRASGTWRQAAYHDLARGLWAMILLPDRATGIPGWARLGGFALLAAAGWLLLALAVATAIRRRLERGLDTAEDVARRVLDGEPLPAPVLERDRANAGSGGPAGLIVDLSRRLQEQAMRYREAESRFATLLDLVPGAAFVASAEGRILAAGAGFRAMVTDPSVPVVGSGITSIPIGLPMDRIHVAAMRARDNAVTVNGLPVEGGEEPVWVSIAPVTFREGEGYLVHVVTESDRFARSEDPGLASVLVDTSADAVVAFDAEARTVLWNRTIERISGRRRVEVPDLKRVVAALFEDEAPRFMAWLDAQPGPEPFEAEIPTADGSRQGFRWTAVELAGPGAVYGGALVGRLVEPARSRRKKAEPATVEAGTERKKRGTAKASRASEPRSGGKTGGKSGGKKAVAASARAKEPRPKAASPSDGSRKSGGAKAASSGASSSAAG